MPQTPQLNALATAIQIMGLAGEASQLYHNIKSLQSVIALNSPISILQAQPTAPVSSAGVISGTPDGSPTVTDPILALGVSYNQLVAAFGYLGDAANCLDGSAAPSQVNRLGTLFAVSGTNA